jgi:hypothetical protein
VLFLARQTSQSVEQFLMANELAGARALAQGYELWDRVIERFIDYPELRQYFYEGVEVPEDSTARARVLAMTELIGDALQSADWLYQGKDVALLGSEDPASDIRTDWDDWTKFISRCRRRCVLSCESVRSSTRFSPGCSTRSSLPRTRASRLRGRGEVMTSRGDSYGFGGTLSQAPRLGLLGWGRGYVGVENKGARRLPR